MSGTVFPLAVAADVAALPVAIVRLLVEHGHLETVSLGGQRLVTAEALQRLLEAVTEADRQVGRRAGGRN